MIVLDIESLKSKKNKVILDNGNTLYLYNSEIKKLNIEIGTVIDESLYELIIRDYIFARAKKKALAILERSINSVYQIRTKLKRADYPEDIIDKVIAFLEEYKFVDDYSYAKIYVEGNCVRKSKLELKMELKKRGISSDIIQIILEEYNDSVEYNAIKKFIRKYEDSEGNIPEEKKNKAMAALYRKGFSSDAIRKCIDFRE